MKAIRANPRVARGCEKKEAARIPHRDLLLAEAGLACHPHERSYSSGRMASARPQEYSALR